MGQRIADILGISCELVSVKAKTGEGVGPVGQELAISGQCRRLAGSGRQSGSCVCQRLARLHGTVTTNDRGFCEDRDYAMTIRVYNTLTRTKELFEPVQPGKVGIYLCGPTVYDKAHIGHMVGPVIFDTIKRDPGALRLPGHVGRQHHGRG